MFHTLGVIKHEVRSHFSCRFRATVSPTWSRGWLNHVALELKLRIDIEARNDACRRHDRPIVLDVENLVAHIIAHPSSALFLPIFETNRRKVTARLEREGWIVRQDGDHDVFKHFSKPGRIPVPRHRELSVGVARSIARAAGWI